MCSPHLRACAALLTLCLVWCLAPAATSAEKQPSAGPDAVRLPDGTIIDRRPGGGWTLRQPDGTVVEFYPDGSLSVRRPKPPVPPIVTDLVKPPDLIERPKGAHPPAGKEGEKPPAGKEGERPPEKHPPDKEGTPIKPPRVPVDPGIRLPQPPPLCGFFQEELKRTVWSGWRAKGGRTVALPGRDPAFIVQWEATIENEFEVIGKCGLPLGHAGDHKPPKRLEYRGQKTVTEEESYPAGTKRPQPPPPLPLPLKGQ